MNFLTNATSRVFTFKKNLFKLTFEMHSFALYNKISDIRLIAMENGMIVCSLLDDWPWFPDEPVQREQKTVSQVSQNKSS